MDHRDQSAAARKFSRLSGRHRGRVGNRLADHHRNAELKRGQHRHKQHQEDEQEFDRQSAVATTTMVTGWRVCGMHGNWASERKAILAQEHKASGAPWCGNAGQIAPSCDCNPSLDGATSLDGPILRVRELLQTSGIKGWGQCESRMSSERNVMLRTIDVAECSTAFGCHDARFGFVVSWR